MPTTEKRLTRLEVEFEQFNTKLDAILEVVVPTHKDAQETKQRLVRVEEKLDNHEIDIDLLKFAIKQHSKVIKVLQEYLPA